MTCGLGINALYSIKKIRASSYPWIIFWGGKYMQQYKWKFGWFVQTYSEEKRSSREVSKKNKLEMSILLKSGQAVQKKPNETMKQQNQWNNKKSNKLTRNKRKKPTNREPGRNT